MTVPDATTTIGLDHSRGRHLLAVMGLATLLARLCLGLAPALLGAQGQPLPERLGDAEGMSAEPVFFSETKLVTLAFTFRPRAKCNRLKIRNAPELGVEDIEILDNGAPQRVAVLSRTEAEGVRTPIDVILLFDCGRDFRPYINPRVVNWKVFEELENVRFSIYGFSDSAYRLVRPTENLAQLTGAMANLSRLPFVPSAKSDAIFQTIQDAVTIPGSRPRMLVVFSNFTRNCNLQLAKPDQHSWEEAVGIARHYDIALFPVVVSPRRLLALNGVGESTGGKTLPGYAMTENILEQVLKYYRTQTRSEFVAGFYPCASSKTDGELHRIVVRLKSEIGEISGGVRTAAYYRGDGPTR